jgi:hypothetical protein
MDPVTAGLNAFAALLKYLTVIAEGQPVEAREKMWGWFIKDIEWWRKVLKIDTEPS